MMARLLQTAQVFTEESLRKIEVVSADTIQQGDLILSYVLGE